MRVVVVGAGLSGLTAAYRLARAGVDVLVLEARDRVGGRAWSVELDGLSFDAGAEAVDDAHGSLLALAREVGVAVLTGTPWTHGDPSLEGDELALFHALGDELAALAARIDPVRPEDVDGAGSLDRQTLAGWLVGRGASPRVLAAAETWYAVASSTVPIAQMSVLAMAAKLAAGAAPGGLRLRLEGGPAGLAERLASVVPVRLGTPVAAIDQGGTGVHLRLASGDAERADRVVLAIPLTLQRALRFDPPLPAHRRLALERARYGEVVKSAFSFGEIAWRGPLAAMTERGVVYEPHPGKPVIAVFAGASAARRDPHDALRAADVDAQPGRSVSVDWSRERFTRGSYLIFGPGDLLEWGRRLAEPHGRVHFAGAETSTLPSYLEGAVRAGDRVAAEITSLPAAG